MRETSHPDMCSGSLNEEAGRGWLALPKLRAWRRLHPPPSEPCPLTSPSPTNKPLTLSLRPGEPQGPCDLTGRNPPRFSSNRFFSSARHSDQINRPLLPGENVSTGPICLSDELREGRQGSMCVCMCSSPCTPFPRSPGGSLPPGMAAQPAARPQGGQVLESQLQEAWQEAAYTLLPTVPSQLRLLVGHLKGFMLLSLWMCRCSSRQRSQVFRNSIWTFRWRRREEKAIMQTNCPQYGPIITLAGKRKNPPHYIKRHKSRPPGA